MISKDENAHVLSENPDNKIDFYVPTMTMARALSVTPIRTYFTYVRLSKDVRTLSRILLFMKIHHLKRCPLSKYNIFYQNFMKLGHIV